MVMMAMVMVRLRGNNLGLTFCAPNFGRSYLCLSVLDAAARCIGNVDRADGSGMVCAQVFCVGMQRKGVDWSDAERQG
jgi:hypothetical protein